MINCGIESVSRTEVLNTSLTASYTSQAPPIDLTIQCLLQQHSCGIVTGLQRRMRQKNNIREEMITIYDWIKRITVSEKWIKPEKATEATMTVIISSFLWFFIFIFIGIHLRDTHRHQIPFSLACLSEWPRLYETCRKLASIQSWDEETHRVKTQTNKKIIILWNCSSEVDDDCERIPFVATSRMSEIYCIVLLRFDSIQTHIKYVCVLVVVRSA